MVGKLDQPRAQRSAFIVAILTIMVIPADPNLASKAGLT